jgi:type VI secretion system secreted protein VgrG
MLIYAKVGDGSIRSGLTARDHEGWFEVARFDFGEGTVYDVRSGATAGEDDDAGGQSAPTNPMFKELLERAKKMRADGQRLHAEYPLFSSSATLTKPVDSVSHDLMEWAGTGDPRRIQFDMCPPGGPVMLSVVLERARVTKYAFEGPTDGARGNAIETLTLDWEELEIHTWELPPEGGDPRGPFSFTWTRPEAPPARTAASGDWKEDFATGLDGAALNWGDAQLDQAPAPATPDSSGFEQLGRTLKVGRIGSAEFALEAFTGSESMSQLFKFKLALVASAAIDPKAVIGKEVAFSIEDESGIDSSKASPPRHFHGIVRRLRAAETGSGDARRYEAIVVPKMWRLTKRTDCRIFQNKTISDIVKAVCSGAGMPASYVDTAALGDADVTLEYCVQYRESDFDFVARLLEAHGIFFFFRHEADKHTLVLAAKTTAYQDCDPAQLVQSSGAFDGKHVSRWSCAWEVVSKKAVLDSRDVSKANAQAKLTAERANNLGLSDTDALELYDYPGSYLTSAAGTKLATAAIESEEATHEVGAGDSSCDQLGVGLKFSFSADEGQADAGASYVLTRVEHSAQVRADATGAAVAYSNRFMAIPSTRVFRPRKRRQRPFLIGTQTAVVVAPDGEEIHTDEFGRIKVRFHWDRNPDVKPEERSCWIRVAQGLAGNGWGIVTLPRKDQEVVVEFLDGDPDRPLVVGAVYNGENKPRDLPAMKTQTVLRTRSSKEGTAETFNELRFEDKKDEEHVFFHCEKDFERIVKHDDKLTVGKDDEGSRTVVINKDSTLTINKGHRLETIKEGNDTLTIEKGDRTIEVKTGKETVTIKGDRSVTIQNGNETLEVTGGDQSVKAGGKIAQESSGEFSIKSSGGKVSVESPQTIELTAGSSKIKIGAAGIVIESSSIKINGKMETKITGAMISVEASGVMKAKGSAVMLG